MTRAFSKKTVDEVWRDIQRCQEDKGSGDERSRVGLERELTLGQMTLEDFLVRAGVMVEGPKTRGGRGCGLGWWVLNLSFILNLSVNQVVGNMRKR